VILGDWGSIKQKEEEGGVSETLTKNSGGFGFHQGAMCYALKDDGSAFFGKDGKGRIELNGNESTISSSSYNNGRGKGMLIDLDDGVLKF
jgi:hypothetical protein